MAGPVTRARRRIASRMQTRHRMRSNSLLPLSRVFRAERACLLLLRPTSSGLIALRQVQTQWNQVLSLHPTPNGQDPLRLLLSLVPLNPLLPHHRREATLHTRLLPLKPTGMTASSMSSSARTRLPPKTELFLSANHAGLSMDRLLLEPRL